MARPVPTSSILGIAVTLWLALILCAGCASSPAVEDGGVGAGQASNVPCEQTHESCKKTCRGVSDSGSRGPCFNGCLKKLQACQANE